MVGDSTAFLNRLVEAMSDYRRTEKSLRFDGYEIAQGIVRQPNKKT